MVFSNREIALHPGYSKTVQLKTGWEDRQNVRDYFRQYAKNILFSSSAQGRYEIWKDQMLLATLFSSAYSKNVPYQFPIEVGPDTKLSVVFKNMDSQAADFYVGYEVDRG